VAKYVREFDPRATEDLEALSTDVAVRIVRRLEELEENPHPRGDTIKRLEGFSVPTYRFRVGDYRAVFQIFGNRIAILRVVHRSQLDRALRKLL
jgi:mRNA interferase RelE/StbE